MPLEIVSTSVETMISTLTPCLWNFVSGSIATSGQPFTKICFRDLLYSAKTSSVLLLTVFTFRKSTTSRRGHFRKSSSRKPSELT